MRGPETERSHHQRIDSGFYSRYMSGQGLDIGYQGGNRGAETVLPTTIGVDLDYPGYDGKTLPFSDESQDYVFSSHCLEHISDWVHVLREWMRVIRYGGYIVITVPHKYLYEKKECPPSRLNGDHKRFYTPSLLMKEIETALSPNSYRLMHMRDNADGFDYSVGPEGYSSGCCEVECVLQKIRMPGWEISSK